MHYEPPKSMAYPAKCGCGRHEIDLTEDERIAYFKGKAWSLKCLSLKKDQRLKKILLIIEKNKKEISQLRALKRKYSILKTVVKSFPCIQCGFKLGNRFKVLDRELVCGLCYETAISNK